MHVCASLINCKPIKNQTSSGIDSGAYARTHPHSRAYRTHMQVMGLASLRKDYKEYEMKRQLCGMYDLFLCDDRIAPLLPRFLGKVFYIKKK